MKHAQGPLLTIDVGTQTAETTNIGDIVSTYIGGRGLNTRLAYERIPFDADPFGPENRLFLATGPMQHSRTSFTGRTSATALSPLTGGLLSSNAGGFISRHITGAGYAAVEIVGDADGPLALHVRDDGVEFEEVPELAQATVPDVSEYMS
ncbi:MAG: Aldehyde:ferredoxin oxidoreductase, partial [uncultured archaeon A07HR60]